MNRLIACKFRLQFLLFAVAGCSESVPAGAQDIAAPDSHDIAAADSPVGELPGYDCYAAEEALHGEVAKALKAASVGCSLASDCTVTLVKSACEGSCGNIIAKAHEADLVSALADIDQKLCKDNGYKQHCTWPVPSCANFAPGCMQGKCQNSQ